jgi:hypothetical protein
MRREFHRGVEKLLKLFSVCVHYVAVDPDESCLSHGDIEIRVNDLLMAFLTSTCSVTL